MRISFFWLLFLLVSCASQDISKLSLQDKSALGDKFYEQGDYSEAIPYYDAIVFQKIGSNTQEVSFRLADCYLQNKQYTSASLEYKQILADYPRFEKLNEVYFNLILCYEHLTMDPQYDQKERYEQIEILKKFLSLYPYDKNVDKAQEFLDGAYFQLTLKKFHNAMIYYKTSDYSSAMLYFKEVLDELDGQKVETFRKSLFYVCLIYLHWGERSLAESYAADIEYYFPQSFEAVEAKRRLQLL